MEYGSTNYFIYIKKLFQSENIGRETITGIICVKHIKTRNT